MSILIGEQGLEYQNDPTYLTKFHIKLYRRDYEDLKRLGQYIGFD